MSSQLDKRVKKYLDRNSRSNRRFSSKRSSTSKAVRQAKRVSVPTSGAKNVRGVIVGGPQGPERKKFEVNQAFTTVSSTVPYVQSLTSGIAQGTAVNQRIGDRIHVKGVDLQFNVQVDGADPTPTGGVWIDLFLILDTQPEESTAAANTIFQNSSTNLTYIQLDSLERFQVLRRQRIRLDGASQWSDQFTWHLSAELACRFGSSTSAPMSNDILVCALCPNTASVTSDPQFAYVSRLTFTDE